MVEQRSPKPRAEGSSPSAPAKESIGFPVLFLFLKHKNPRHARAGAKAKNVKAVMALLDLEGGNTPR